MNSLEFTTALFEKASVVVAAGTAYGQHGEGFVRISLTVPDKRLEEAMERIKKNFRKINELAPGFEFTVFPISTRVLRRTKSLPA